MLCSVITATCIAFVGDPTETIGWLFVANVVLPKMLEQLVTQLCPWSSSLRAIRADIGWEPAKGGRCAVSQLLLALGGVVLTFFAPPTHMSYTLARQIVNGRRLNSVYTLWQRRDLPVAAEMIWCLILACHPVTNFVHVWYHDNFAAHVAVAVLNGVWLTTILLWFLSWR